MYRINKTLVYFLVLTLVGAALAMNIVTKAYDSVYADYSIQ